VTAPILDGRRRDGLVLLDSAGWGWARQHPCMQSLFGLPFPPLACGSSYHDQWGQLALTLPWLHVGLLLITGSADLVVGGRCSRHLFLSVLHLCTFAMLFIISSRCFAAGLCFLWRILCRCSLLLDDLCLAAARVMDGCFAVVLRLMSQLL